LVDFIFIFSVESTDFSVGENK